MDCSKLYILRTYNMGTCDLPDMYALQITYIHIRQISRAYVTIISYI